MKKTTLPILVLGTIILLCGDASAAGERYSDDYGVTEGTPVKTGVVFVDGDYLTPPYVVSRHGLALYVNHREIKRPRRHMETPVLTETDDPSRLTGRQREKLARALEATRTIYEKYLARGHGYMFSSQGGHVRLSPYVIGYKLPKVVELLASDMPRNDKLQRLQVYNWHLHINIEPLVDNFIPSSQLASTMAEQAYELLQVERFGVGEPVPVAGGFVFLNGRYIEQPYTLQRRGLGLFLNDELMIPPPPSMSILPSGDKDVSMPAEIDAETSWFDEPLLLYLARKKAYLFKQYSARQARDMMAVVIAALPLVTNVEKDKEWPSILHVATTEGLTIPYWLHPSSSRAPGTGNSPKSVERKLEHIRHMLCKGSCYLVFRDSGRTCLPATSLKQTLPLLVTILSSNTSKEAKHNEIKRLYPGMPDRAVDELAGNFSQSSQLTARVAFLMQG